MYWGICESVPRSGFTGFAHSVQEYFCNQSHYLSLAPESSCQGRGIVRKESSLSLCLGPPEVLLGVNWLLSSEQRACWSLNSMVCLPVPADHPVHRGMCYGELC